MEITISDSELDLFLSNVFKFPVEKKIEFSNFLNDQGIDEDIVREQARAELLWNKIINQRFAGFITVSELEINEEKKIYDNNIGTVQFNFSEILVNKDDLIQVEKTKKYTRSFFGSKSECDIKIEGASLTNSIASV